MTNKVRTCVYAISLNEIKHVDSFMESCKEADLVLVCDTGSTDGTAERLRELGATVHDILVKPWRFDVARNTALNLIPKDIDICMTVDLDEQLQPGWSLALQEAWDKNNGVIDRVAYDYVWNWKEDGSPDVRFYGDRWHSRQNYIWKHPCHETIYYVGQSPEVRVTIPGCHLHHHADNSKSRGQYLPLLKLAIDEDPNNDRMRHYYGRELMFKGLWHEAITCFEHHLSMPTALWNEERAASLRYISRCYRNLGLPQQGLDYAIKSVLECNTAREPWIEVARAAQNVKDWQTCYWAATKCLSITTRTLSYMSDSESWGEEPFDQAALSAYHLGMYEQAVEYGQEALDMNPTNQRLLTNLAFYKQALSQ